MPTFRITIMLKPGVLDAPGQAIERGLRALAYDVDGVRAGKVIEMTVPEAMRARVGEMCERFLANPLIEIWRIEEAVPATGEGRR
jgi:phosphoribosylformylglycinamidine synthase